MAEEFQFQFAKFGRNPGLSLLSAKDVRQLQKRLKEIDPMLRTQLVRDAKAVAKPIVSDIKGVLGTIKPPSGMLRPGARLNWNNGIDAKGRSHKLMDVKPVFRTAESGRSKTTGLVKVKVGNPAVTLADMGGRSGRYRNAGYKGSGYTIEYPYKNGTRRHKVNGQFKGIEQTIGNSPSRFVWGAAEKSLPAAREAIEKILRDAYTRINAKGF